MKKLVCIILIGLLSIGVCCACGKNETEGNKTDEPSSSTELTEDKENDKNTDDTMTESVAESESEDTEYTDDTTDETEDKPNSSETTGSTVGNSNTNSGNATSNNGSSTGNGGNSTSNNGSSIGNNGNSTSNSGNSGGQNNQTELNTKINKILSEIITSSMTDLEKTVAIHDYITYNIDYDITNYSAGIIKDTSTHSIGVLQTGWAVCQGYATLFYDMASAAGLEVTYVVGTVDEGYGVMSHAWNQIKIGNKWYNLDVTWDDPTFLGKEHQDNSSNNYWLFLVSDASLKKACHIWDNSTAKTCSSDIGTRDLYNALKNVNKRDDAYFAETEKQFETVVESALAKGMENFKIYTPGEEEYGREVQIIEKVFAKKGTSYDCISGNDGALKIHNVVKDKNIYPMKEFGEIKDIVRNYKGSYDNLKIRCYNEAFTKYNLTDYNLRTIVSYEMACAGIAAELNTYTEITDNYTTITLESCDSKGIVINDFAELVSLGNLSEGTTVWYSGGSIPSENMHETVYQSTIPKGKKIYFTTGDRDDYYGITSFIYSSTETVMYAANMDEVKALGIDRLVSEMLYTPASANLKSQISDYIAEQLGKPYVSYGGHEDCGFLISSYYSE